MSSSVPWRVAGSQLLRLKKQTNRVTDRQSDTDHARLLVFFWSPCGPKDDWISVEAALPCRSCGTVTNWSSPMCGDKLPRATRCVRESKNQVKPSDSWGWFVCSSCPWRYFADQTRKTEPAAGAGWILAYHTFFFEQLSLSYLIKVQGAKETASAGWIFLVIGFVQITLNQ